MSRLPGEIGFKLSNGRLPWSTLEGDLQKKGYVVVNWPQGVVRDRDKGISGLSAEDTDKLHDALFVDEHRLQFVPRVESKLITIIWPNYGLPSPGSTDSVSSLAVASSSYRSRENEHSMVIKQAKFRVTTSEAYAGHSHSNKRRRV